MKRFSIQISLTIVASLIASFSSIASVGSDGASGIELRPQYPDGPPRSLLISEYALPCQHLGSEPVLDTSAMIGFPAHAYVDGVVQPPYEPCAFGTGPALDVQPRMEAEDIRDEPPSSDLWQRIRAGFAMPSIESPRVARYQAQYLKSPGHLRRVIERSRPYLYFIVDELEKRGMPSEIALLPIIESAYNPQAVSPKRAAGLWQFMPATGREYGLYQEPWYDGRRDVVAASRAALDYLQFLHDTFDDWQLALAAYNWGGRAVQRARTNNAARSRPTRYGSLKMPNETRNYLPRLQAVKNLIANPALLNLPTVPNEPYFAETKPPGAIDVIKLARLADVPVEEFRSLNPGYRGPVIIQTATRNILLPVDRMDLFEANLKMNKEPLLTWQAYTPRRGDTLQTIARKFAIGVRELREANGLTSSQRNAPPGAILVPSGEVEYAQNMGDISAMATLLEATDKHGTLRRTISKKKLRATAM